MSHFVLVWLPRKQSLKQKLLYKLFIWEVISSVSEWGERQDWGKSNTRVCCWSCCCGNWGAQILLKPLQILQDLALATLQVIPSYLPWIPRSSVYDPGLYEGGPRGFRALLGCPAQSVKVLRWKVRWLWGAGSEILRSCLLPLGWNQRWLEKLCWGHHR